MTTNDTSAEVAPPTAGRSLYVGPSNVGKTRRTAAALDAWIDEHSPDGVAVFDFAPEIERDGNLLGGRLDRFTTIPDRAWTGVLDAHAPRTEGRDESEIRNLARSNADRAATLIGAAPDDPRAVFVNDATIAFQHETGDLDGFLAYCERADRVALNAFESTELGVEDAVSKREKNVRDRLRRWVDCVIDLR